MSWVAIVGGGITGLAAAWELQQRGIDYRLFEAGDRLGGKIVTERVDGFLIEGGADSFLSSKPWAWQLCREIGLGERLIGTNETQRAVYVWSAGRLQPLPRGLRLIAPLDPGGLQASSLFSEAGKRRMLAEATLPPAGPDGDESLGAFIRRRFGREALALLGEPLLAGIYVGRAERLSLQATFPQLRSLERTHGSVTAGLRQATAPPPPPGLPPTAFLSLPGGIGELIERLAGRLTGTIECGRAVTAITTDRRLRLADGSLVAPAATLLTTPLAVSARLAGALLPSLATAAQATTQASSGTVSLGFRADQVDHPLDGYGFIVPRHESTRLLAGTFSSTKLAGRAPEGYVLMRVFVGGPGRSADLRLSDTELVSLARRELQAILGITAAPVISRVFRWRRANPQYRLGHVERIAAARALAPPWLRLAGSGYDGVGIPDCIRQARAAAAALA